MKKYMKLRGIMAEKGMSQKELAESIGMSTNSLSRKLIGKRDFTISEAIDIIKALEIKDPADIFFNDIIPNTQQRVI